VRRLIVTGDDFGLAVPVNEAVEAAHRDGILAAASLMVGGDAVTDAVERARRLPALRVGLHVVLVEGRPVLPPASVPDLVGADGEFRRNLTAAGFRFFFQPGIRRQIEAEVRAQFEAFRQTGLRLDHANSHNHMHLHPTVLRIILRVGRSYGLDAMRVPYEPPLAAWRASRRGGVAKTVAGLALVPWTGLLRRRLRQARIKANDFVFGMSDSGGMDEVRLLALLGQVPRDGVTEIYFHAATRRCPQIDRTMRGYRHEDELAALTSPRVRDELVRRGLVPIGFGDL
jgi:hopanoid biosynthesis associated protein HpnK